MCGTHCCPASRRAQRRRRQARALAGLGRGNELLCAWAAPESAYQCSPAFSGAGAAKLCSTECSQAFAEACWPPPPAGAVMCSYNAWRGAPSCASKELLTDLLRGQMGFQGFVVTDKFGEHGL